MNTLNLKCVSIDTNFLLALDDDIDWTISGRQETVFL